MLTVCLKCSCDHVSERSGFTLQPPSMARSLSFCGGSGTGQFQYLCIRLLSSPLTSCCCRSYRHSTRTDTILTRIQPQRKRNAKFRVLSSRMVSSDRVFPTSTCFPCECQTLLIRRNALSDSCLCTLPMAPLSSLSTSSLALGFRIVAGIDRLRRPTDSWPWLSCCR